MLLIYEIPPLPTFFSSSSTRIDLLEEMIYLERLDLRTVLSEDVKDPCEIILLHRTYKRLF